jgi:GTPase
VEFYIDGIYQVTGVGLVVAGTLKAGTVLPNQILNLGPDKSGLFKHVQVKSIHHKRLAVEKAYAG